MSIVVDGREYLSTTELHVRIGLSKFHLRKLARDSKIPAKKVGKRWYYDLDNVISEFMQDNGFTKTSENIEELNNAAPSEGNPLEVEDIDLG